MWSYVLANVLQYAVNDNVPWVHYNIPWVHLFEFDFMFNTL